MRQAGHRPCVRLVLTAELIFNLNFDASESRWELESFYCFFFNLAVVPCSFVP